MYELEGLLLLYAFSLPEPDPSYTCTLARGIAVLLDNVICIGTYEGNVMVLSVPARGNNIELIETLRFHTYPIAALDGSRDCLVVADEKGEISIWQAGQPFTRVNCILFFLSCPTWKSIPYIINNIFYAK